MKELRLFINDCNDNMYLIAITLLEESINLRIERMNLIRCAIAKKILLKRGFDDADSLHE